ncbi:MAG: PKD domain-containing protein [Actinomycetota bacterium]|nr:PKD domain-containing protein [Actinomycetota bacterium]
MLASSRPARLAALLAALVALLALAPAAASAADHNPKGHFLGVIKAALAGHRAAPSRAAGTDPLAYHGGPVMHSNRAHIVYWEPSGHTTTSAYKTLVERYVSDVAAASGAFDNVYGINVQYTDSSGRANYASTFAGSLVDTTPYPGSGCTHPTLPAGSVCLTDAQVRGELDSVIAANGLSRGMGDVYFMLTPQGVGSCTDSSPTAQCSYKNYCAYHSAFPSGGQQTIYAMQPWADDPHCSVDETPNSDVAADSVANLISHEHNESITDPLGNGWFDGNGDENGDKCAWKFGSTLGTSPNAYNQSINSNHYILQQEWSNASSGCALTMDAPPAASFTVTPANPQAGTAVAFDGNGSSDSDGTVVKYAWSFGDGTAVTGTSPATSHSYANPGTYTARLTVTDNGNVTDSTTRSLTVTAAAAPPKFTSGSPPATQTQPVPVPVTTTAARPSLAFPTQVNRVTKQRVALVRLRCGAATACRGRVSIYARVRAAGGRFRTIMLGVASFSLRAGRTASVRVPLTLRAGSLLAQYRRVSVTLRASAPGALSVSRSATLAR